MQTFKYIRPQERTVFEYDALMLDNYPRYGVQLEFREMCETAGMEVMNGI
jgi:hypothetical protein